MSALFRGDKSDEISKVEIPLDTEGVKQKKIPDWVIVLVLVVLVAAALGVVYVMVHKEPGPSAEVDPAVQLIAEKRRQAIGALEEGHKLALEGKAKADDAIKAYSHALELDPNLASAERGLAIAYAAKEDEEQAVEHYKNYLKLAPQAPDADTVRKIVSDYEKKKAQKKAAAEAPKEEPKPPPSAKSKLLKRHHR
jgi:tetratricopeptide (TPR) repeat protein